MHLHALLSLQQHFLSVIGNSHQYHDFCVSHVVDFFSTFKNQVLHIRKCQGLTKNSSDPDRILQNRQKASFSGNVSSPQPKGGKSNQKGSYKVEFLFV